MKTEDILQNTAIMYKRERDIDRWLKQHRIRSFTLNPDLSVNVNESAIIKIKTSNLPVKFKSVRGNFKLYGDFLSPESSKFSSLKGCPTHVGGNFEMSDLLNLKSLKYAPSYIGGNFSYSEIGVYNLHGIHNMIKQINGRFSCAIAFNVLGLCLIKGIKAVDIWQRSEATKIINKYLHDIHLCQEALLDAGYSEMANL